MDKFTTEVNGKDITISQVKGQPYLFNITIKGSFLGYIDTTDDKSLLINSIVSPVEEKELRLIIKEALKK
ncbi:hypothetical protein [Pedobacter sp. NJ-S-72]